jgi:colanic acid biosynthesis glycosyl transferase WcaI
MKILVYGLNYAPEATGIGKYTGEMAEWLALQGHDVRVVTAPPYYPMWKVQNSYRNWYSRVYLNGVDVIRCPLYVPSGDVTVSKRLLHLMSFAISSSLVLFCSLFWRPKLVINIVPALFTTPAALVFSKLSGAKLVLHIQDFESDAMFGLGMAELGVVAKVCAWLERRILGWTDKVTTISQAMMANAVAKGANKDNITFFPNWSEVERFKSVENVREYKTALGLPINKKIVLYSGNVGRKQGLEVVIEAAELSRDRVDIHYVICGDGSAKSGLEKDALSKKLKNIEFLPLQPYENLPQLLALADVHLVIQNPGVADAVLPSKLTNILAVGGNSVITANMGTELGLLVEQYPGIATIVEPQSVSALIEGIIHAVSMPRPNLVAAGYATKSLDKDHVLRQFENSISQMF